MAVETLEERVQKMESTLKEVQEKLANHIHNSPAKQRGWRWFVGIDADNAHFDEAGRAGQEWRKTEPLHVNKGCE